MASAQLSDQRPLISRKAGCLWSHVYAKPISSGQRGRAVGHRQGSRQGVRQRSRGRQPTHRCTAVPVWERHEPAPQPLLLTH